MSAEYDVLVIGGGAAGLATSRELARAGVDTHLVVERGNEVGQTWAHLYDSLVLHTPLKLSALPGLAFPPGTPLFPTRLDYLGYLCKYAEAFSVPLRLGTGVVELRLHSNMWYARTAYGAELSARAVVVATGIASQPHVPDLPGREHFEGRVLHSAEYRRPSMIEGLYSRTSSICKSTLCTCCAGRRQTSILR